MNDCATADPGGDEPAWQRFGLGVLCQAIPPGLIDAAVAATGTGQRRLRLLPSRVVVLFVLGLALFSTEGYVQVWRQLVSGWPGLARLCPTRSAFTKARRRVGVAPLAWLFTQVRGVCGQMHAPGVWAFGLRLVAWDGTKLQVPDTAANAAAFGRDRGGGGRVAGFPRLWLLALVECGTRAVLDAAFGQRSEQALAEQVLPALGEGMLLLADRNFSSYHLWTQVRSRGAHLLWRVAGNRVLPVLRVLPDGSWLSRITPSQAERKAGATPVTVRVLRYTITVTATDRAGRRSVRRETFRLITSLLDPAHAPARDLAGCYTQRWESENGYKELKVWLRGPSVVLRSHQPDDVRQELWAYLIIYQALRHLIVEVAAEQGIDADRLSFVTCLRLTKLKIINLAVVDGADLTNAHNHLVDHLLADEITHRRQRTSPRTVKRPHKPYKAKQPGMNTTPVTYHLDIHPAHNQESA
jgi:Insertion element 4 transposase N-terminal/Transposase DDE domain